MLAEVNSTINFLSELLKRKAGLPPDLLLYFSTQLHHSLTLHYAGHWFPDRPQKGSAYRCIRINGILDPVVARAVEKAGLAKTHIHSAFPEELTIWVDPGEVCYRFGENGSVGRIFPPPGCSFLTTATTYQLPSYSESNGAVNPNNQSKERGADTHHHNQLVEQRESAFFASSQQRLARRSGGGGLGTPPKQYKSGSTIYYDSVTMVNNNNHSNTTGPVGGCTITPDYRIRSR